MYLIFCKLSEFYKETNEIESYDSIQKCLMDIEYLEIDNDLLKKIKLSCIKGGYSLIYLDNKICKKHLSDTYYQNSIMLVVDFKSIVFNDFKIESELRDRSIEIINDVLPTIKSMIRDQKLNLIFTK